MSIPEKSPRILLVRLGALGDVIHAMPVACALREHFPKAFLAWAVEQRAGELIEGHPVIDRRILCHAVGCGRRAAFGNCENNCESWRSMWRSTPRD